MAEKTSSHRHVSVSNYVNAVNLAISSMLCSSLSPFLFPSSFFFD